MAGSANNTGLDPAWLKAELKVPGRSQLELARLLGLHHSSVVRICSGERRITDAEGQLIRQYLADTKVGRSTPETQDSQELAKLISLWSSMRPAERRRALAIMQVLAAE